MPVNYLSEKSKNKRNRGLKILLFFILTILFCYYLVFFQSAVFLKDGLRLLSIKTIKIKGDQCNNNFIGADLLKEKTFLTILINKEKIKKELESLNPQIRKIDLNFNSVNELFINISCFYPLAYIKQDGYFLYLSENGRILFKKKEPEKNLTAIDYYQKIPYFYKTGDWLNFKDLKLALLMIKTLNDLGYKSQKVQIKSEDFIILYVDNKNIIFSSSKDDKRQKLELTEILKQFKIKGRDFQKLDLRFDKPVVVF